MYILEGQYGVFSASFPKVEYAGPQFRAVVSLCVPRDDFARDYLMLTLKGRKKIQGPGMTARRGDVKKTEGIRHE